MDSFIFHMEYAGKIKQLSEKERLILFDSMLAFAEADGDVTAPEMELATSFLYAFITDRMKADHEYYEQKCETNRKNGKKGGRPRKHPLTEAEAISEKSERFFIKPNGFSEKPNKTLFDYDSDYDSDFESDSQTDCRPDHRPDRAEPSVSQSASERKQLPTTTDPAPPSLDEVMQEFKDRPSETVRKAFDHYQSTGWTDGSGRPVKAWKKVLGRFIDGERPDRQTRQTKRKSGWDFKERNQDYDKIALQLIQQQNAELDALEGGQYDDDSET